MNDMNQCKLQHFTTRYTITGINNLSDISDIT